MKGTSVACCRTCGSHHVTLVHIVTTIDGRPNHAYYYSCQACGAVTHGRSEANLAAEDVDWCPSQDVRIR